jgi:hypothetical protein
MQCVICEKYLDELKVCDKCKSYHYCSNKCQINDWKNGHKEKCIPYESEFDELRDDHLNAFTYKRINKARLYEFIKNSADSFETIAFPKKMNICEKNWIRIALEFKNANFEFRDNIDALKTIQPPKLYGINLNSKLFEKEKEYISKFKLKELELNVSENNDIQNIDFDILKNIPLKILSIYTKKIRTINKYHRKYLFHKIKNMKCEIHSNFLTVIELGLLLNIERFFILWIARLKEEESVFYKDFMPLEIFNLIIEFCQLKPNAQETRNYIMIKLEPLEEMIIL